MDFFHTHIWMCLLFCLTTSPISHLGSPLTSLEDCYQHFHEEFSHVIGCTCECDDRHAGISDMYTHVWKAKQVTNCVLVWHVWLSICADINVRTSAFLLVFTIEWFVHINICHVECVSVVIVFRFVGPFCERQQGLNWTDALCPKVLQHLNLSNSD